MLRFYGEIFFNNAKPVYILLHGSFPVNVSDVGVQHSQGPFYGARTTGKSCNYVHDEGGLNV